jgi:hypothetical protein
MKRAALLLLVPILPSCSGEVEPPAKSAPPAPAAVLEADPPPAPVPGPPPPIHDFEREEDPARAATLRLESNWELDPCFTDLTLRFLDGGPAIVGLVADGEGRFPDRAGREVDEALRWLDGEFRTFVRSAGLTPEECEDGSDSVQVAIFPDREAFDAWHERNRIGHPGSAYYARWTGRVLLWIEEDGGTADHAIHLGTFALLHRFRRRFTQIDDDARARAAGLPTRRVGSDDHRLETRLAWFDEGLARWFVSRRRAAKAGGSPAPPEEDVRAVREADESGILWRLDDFLFADRPSIRARSMVAGSGRGRARDLEFLALRQGALLFRHLLEGDGGAMRAGLLGLARREFSGHSGKTDLLEAFGLPGKADAPEVRKWIAGQDEAYLAGILARK